MNRCTAAQISFRAMMKIMLQATSRATVDSDQLIACMESKTVLNIISVILQQPVQLSMLSWNSVNEYFTQYSSKATGCFST